MLKVATGKFPDMTSLDALAGHGIRKTVLAIGVFDGVHRGHQRILSSLLDLASQEDATPVVLTFFPHPRQILQPDAPPALLLPPEKKVALLHRYGVQAVVTIPFTSDFATMPPEEFLEDCLFSSRVALRGICVGKEWRFGAEGKGGFELLSEYARRGHFKFEAIDELRDGENFVSSTEIRRAISAGLLEKAEEMLGRPYSLCGTVEGGNHIAGPELSCPTANLHIRYGVMPPNGVYAGRVSVDGKDWPAVAAIGIAPTLGQALKQARVEVHIIDIYGRGIEIELLRRIREERCFPSLEELKKQIQEDIRQALAALEDKKNG